MKKLQRVGKRLLLLCMLFVTLMLSLPMPVTRAASLQESWVQDSEYQDAIYGSSNSGMDSEADGEMDDDEDVGWVEKLIAGLIANLGRGVNLILNGGDEKTVKADIDSVIRGRILPGITTNWFSFELVDNNPWGYIGNTLFILTRSCFMPLLVLLVTYMLFKCLWDSNKAKDLSDVKSVLQFAVLFLCFLYVFPYLVDVVLYVKDAMMAFLAKELLGDAHVSLVQVFWDNYEGERSIINAVMYCAAVGSGVYFVSNYTGTVLQQTFLYGFTGFFTAFGVKFRKLFSTVMGTFFPNLFIPLIDFTLLIFPLKFGILARDILGTELPFLLKLFQLFMIWAIIPSRTAILRAVGVMTGGAPGGGMGGLAVLAGTAMMAMRMGKGGGGGGSKMGSDSGSDGGRSKDSKNSATFEREMGETLANDPFSGEGNDSSSVMGSESGGNTGGDSPSVMGGGSEENAGGDSPSPDSFSGEDGGAESIPTREENLLAMESSQGAYDSAAGNYEQASLDYENAKADHMGAQAQMDQISAKYDSPDATMSAEDSQSMKELKAQKAEASGAMAQAQKDKAEAKTKMSHASSDLGRQQALENSYADFDKQNGGTGKSFSSAADLQRENRLKEAKKQFINHRNFDNKEFDGVLTHQEKADYYKKRANYQKIEKGAKVIGGVATAAVGAGVTMGMSASVAFGGQQASMGVAKVGAIASTVAATKLPTAVSRKASSVNQYRNTGGKVAHRHHQEDKAEKKAQKEAKQRANAEKQAQQAAASEFAKRNEENLKKYQGSTGSATEMNQKNAFDWTQK